MRNLFRNKLYLPAYSIIAVVLVLLVLIGMSTHRNLDREKRQAMSLVHRQGVTLLRVIEAGVRAAVTPHADGQDAVTELIRGIAGDHDVAYLYLFDRTGAVVHHSNPEGIEETGAWIFEDFTAGWVNSRLVTMPDGSHVYEIGKLFTPVDNRSADTQEAMSSDTRSGRVPHVHAGDAIVVGLALSAYETARKSDLNHAFVMSGIVLVVGSGALFFIFIIQNYYLVDRTLKQTRDYARQIVDSIRQGVISTDRAGRVVSCNSQALLLLGLDASSAQGALLESVLSPVSTGLERALNDCTTCAEEDIMYVRPDGSRVPIGVSASPIVGNRSPCSGSVLLIRDLREIRRLEERIRRSEKLAATGKLAAGIAHEIRNPLSSIRGFAQFLHHALKDRPTDQEYAAIMITEMDRINRVVSDLLSFAGPRAAEPIPCDVEEIVTHVVRLVASEATARSIRIETRVRADLGRPLLDGHQITQALLNLLLNALRFVDPGGWVRIGADRDEQNGELSLEVEDDGVGIPEKNLPLLFDPFFTTRETGTGLGLAIVHKIVENHQGEIDVESPPPGKDRGSRFVIRIPLVGVAGDPGGPL